jgi:hypothetical protein
MLTLYTASRSVGNRLQSDVHSKSSIPRIDVSPIVKPERQAPEAATTANRRSRMGLGHQSAVLSFKLQVHHAVSCRRNNSRVPRFKGLESRQPHCGIPQSPPGIASTALRVYLQKRQDPGKPLLWPRNPLRDWPLKRPQQQIGCVTCCASFSVLYFRTCAYVRTVQKCVWFTGDCAEGVRRDR